jgi:hypothetical protein
MGEIWKRIWWLCWSLRWGGWVGGLCGGTAVVSLVHWAWRGWSKYHDEWSFDGEIDEVSIRRMMEVLKI